MASPMTTVALTKKTQVKER